MKIVRLIMACAISLEFLLSTTLARSSENWFIPKSITYKNRLPVNHFRYKFTQEFADQYNKYAISQLSLIGDLSDDQIDEIEAEYKFWKMIIEAVKIAIDIKTIKSMSTAQIVNFLNDPDFLQVILNVFDRAGIILPDESDTVFKEAILVIAKLYVEILKTLPENVPFTTDMVKLTKKVNVTGSATFWIGIGADIAGITNSMVHAVQLKRVTNVMYSHLIAHEFIKAHVCPKWKDNGSIFYLEGTPLSCNYQSYEGFIASTYDDYANEYGGIGFPGVNAINSDGDFIKYTAGGVFKLYTKIPNKKGGSSLEDWYNSLDWTDYAILSPGNYDVSIATSVIETYYGLNNATNYSIILLNGNERLLSEESRENLRGGDEIKLTTPFHNQSYKEEILAYDFHYKVKQISIYKVNRDMSEDLITGTKYGVNIFKKVALTNGENIFKEVIELSADNGQEPTIVTRYFFVNTPKKSILSSIPAILTGIKNNEPHALIPANKIIGGKVKFQDSHGNKLALPANAWIRIVPAINQNNLKGWDGINCKIYPTASHSSYSGFFGPLSCYVYSQNTLNLFSDSSETFQVIIYEQTQNQGEDGWAFWNRNEQLYCSYGDNVPYKGWSTHTCSESEGGNSINGVISGKVNFFNSSNQQVSVPGDSWIRITPSKYQVNGSWSGINCKLSSSGTFGNSDCYTSENVTTMEEVFADINETYQVVIFKNHIDPNDFHWNCGEDVYKYVGDGLQKSSWSSIAVYPSDYQDRSDESCND